MTEYLVWMGASALAVALWYGWMCARRWGKTRGAAQAGLSLLLGSALGAVCAKAGYMLLRADLFSLEWSDHMIRTWDPDTLSFCGGAAGACLGVHLAGRLIKLPARDVMNLFAPAGAAMAAMARFGESFLGMLGVGQYLENSFFPVAMPFTWDGEWVEYYLAVFIYEGIAAAVACVLSLKHGGEKDRFRRTVFYICLPQILLESLRMQSISWLFVRCEQLVCYLICEVILVWYGVRSSERGGKRWVPALTGAVLCAVVIVGEFALDGKISLSDGDIPRVLIYGVMAMGLAAVVVAEHAGHRRLQRQNQVKCSV